MSNLFLDGHKLMWHLDSVEDWVKGGDITPIHAEISPSIECNQRCPHCYQDFRERGAILEKEIFLNLIRSFKNFGVKSVLLAGEGEPMMNKHTPEAIVYGWADGIDMALNSNGVIMKPEIAEKILPCLTWFRWSIMAATPGIYAKTHGTTSERDLEKAKENIRMCVEIKRKKNLEVILGIQQVLFNENASEVYKVAKLSKELGVDYFVLKPFSLHPQNKYRPRTDLYLIYEKELKKAETLSDKKFTVIIRWNTFEDQGKRNYDRCLGLPFLVQISSNGGVYSCCPFFHDDRFLYGDLHKESFERILFGTRRKKVIQFVKNEVDVHSECMTHCRHHNINKFCWMLKHPPDHRNFP